MKQPSEEAVRQRLLVCGLRIFAEKGYAGATVREICKAAKSNVASINYYYGDKSGFYQAVCQYAWGLRCTVTDKTWEMMQDDPWEALRYYVGVMLDATFDDTMAQIQALFLRELIGSRDHNGDMDDASQKHAEESRKEYDRHMQELLSKILGDAATETNMRLLRYTFFSMGMYLQIQCVIEDSFYKTESSFNLRKVLDKEKMTDFIMRRVRQTVDDMKAGIACNASEGQHSAEG